MFLTYIVVLTTTLQNLKLRYHLYVEKNPSCWFWEFNSEKPSPTELSSNTRQMRALFSPLSTLTYWGVRQLPPACAGGSHTRAAVGASTAAHSHGSASHALRELARARPVELRRRPALAATSYPRRDARWLPHARVGELVLMRPGERLAACLCSSCPPTARSSRAHG